MATLHEVAAHLGVTIKYVQDLIANGTLEKKGRGEYDLNACREAYITRLRERGARKLFQEKFGIRFPRLVRAGLAALGFCSIP